jgi:hypothetical protein
MLIIEPLGSILCGRSKPEIGEQSQVVSPQMIDPSGSTIRATTVRKVRGKASAGAGLEQLAAPVAQESAHRGRTSSDGR